MNRKSSFIISFILFLLLSGINDNIFAQGNYPTLVRKDNFKKEIELDTIFKYHFGDSAQWSLPGYDDSQWRWTAADTTKADTLLQEHTGIVWYRGEFKIDSGFSGEPFMLEVLCHGACEIFLDGKLIKTIGKV